MNSTRIKRQKDNSQFSERLKSAAKQQILASKLRSRHGAQELLLERRYGIAAIVAASLFPWAAQGATVTWDSGGGSPTTDGTGTWSTSSAQWWDGSAAGAWSNGFDAIIGSSNGAAGTITVSGSLAVNSITLNAPGSGNYTITGGTLGVAVGITVNNSATLGSAVSLTGSNLWNIGSGQTLTVSGGISGGSALTKSGVGILTLNGVNTFTGATTVNGGVLKAASVNALGSSTQMTLGGGTLEIASAISTVPSLTLAASSTSGLIVDSGGSLTISSYSDNNSKLTATIASSGTLAFNNAGTATANALTLSGSGVFLKTGAGTFIIQNATSTVSIGTGGLIDVEGGTFRSNNGNVNWSSNQSSLTVASNGVFDCWSQGVTIDALNGSGVVQNGYAPYGVKTLTLGVANSSGTFSGIIGASGTNANGVLNQIAVTKNGTGTQDLTGSNGYTGATTINAGILQIGDGTVNGDISTSQGIVNNATLIFNRTDSSTFSYNQAISGIGSLVKTGGGTQILTAANIYSGGTILNEGVLQLGNGGTTGSLSPGSPITNDGTLTFNRSNTLTQGSDFAATVAGTGGVRQAGTGRTVLSGSNSYSGGTTVNSGTLQIGNANALGSGGLTVNGGLLDLNGNSIGIGALSGSGDGSITANTSGTSTLTTTVSSGTSNYAGSIISGTGAVVLTKKGAGALVLSGSLNMAGLNANAGVTALAQSGSIGALSVSGSGVVVLTSHTGGGYKVLETSSLSITPGGNINLWNNAMVLRASGTSENATNLTAVKASVNAASDGLKWDGVGIGSTTAYNEAQPTHTQALALMVYDNTVIKQGSFEGVSGLGYFDGETPVGYNQVLVKLTYLGDFNADGVINASDYTWLDGYALGANTLGDLNGDGVVNATDYTWLDGSALNQSFGVLAGQQSGSSLSPVTTVVAAAPAVSGVIAASPETVPEPGSLGLLLAGAMGLFGFRRQAGKRR